MMLQDQAPPHKPQGLVDIHLPWPCPRPRWGGGNKNKTPPKPPETWQPCDPPTTPKLCLPNKSNFFLYFFWVSGLRVPPTAPPATLPSSLHRRPGEASRYLLSSLPGVGIPRLSRSRAGGRAPLLQQPEGPETPPARHRPGAVDSGSAPRARGAGRETYLRGGAPGAPASQSAAPQPPHLPAARSPHPPQQRRPVPHFSEPGKLAESAEVGGGGGAGGSWERSLRILWFVCLFVCLDL